MATLSIQTKVTIDDFVEAAEQLQTAELEKLARRLLQIHARRKAPNLPQREAELLEAIAQSGSFDRQARYHQLNRELERRALTQEEQNELRELIGLSEAQTAQRLALLIELSQLRRVSLSTLMKQLQIKAPGVV
jgi:SpoVK/Ycf46/Vps4 family AAA+-type ATPase